MAADVFVQKVQKVSFRAIFIATQRIMTLRAGNSTAAQRCSPVAITGTFHTFHIFRHRRHAEGNYSGCHKSKLSSEIYSTSLCEGCPYIVAVCSMFVSESADKPTPRRGGAGPCACHSRMFQVAPELLHSSVHDRDEWLLVATCKP